MFKKFLQYIFFSLISFLFFVVLIVAIAAFTMGARVADNSLLVLNVAGPLLEEGPQGLKERLLVGDVLTTRDIVLTLQKAKHDKRIRGLLVTAMNARMGFGKSQDVRQAIKDFSSQKPAYGFIEDGDTLEYYICSAAPKLYMPPSGEGGITLAGLRAEVPFLKGTLDLLGIEAQMDHIGQYKSASDMWTRESMSDAHRESTESLLDGLYNRLTSDIARDRGLTAEQVKALIDRGPLVRSEVLNGKLITALKYRDELDEMIKKDFKVDELKTISVENYKEPTFMESMKGATNKIAIVYASGAITPGDSSRGYEEDYVGSSTIANALRQARKDDTVKAVILRVDSPGGSAVASDLIWREVVVTRKTKPVVVSMSDVAASGGYYISMGANKIFASPSTITGSIGVVYGKFYLKGLYDKIGIHKEVIQRGEHADLFSDYAAFDEEEWEIIRKHMRAIYDDFTAKAADGRKKTKEQIDMVGQGRVWTGEQALQHGLIDELGGFSDAIREAKKLGKIDQNADVSFAIFPARQGTFGDLLGGADAKLQLPDDIHTMLSYARLAERDSMLLLMPYQIRWN